MVCYQSVRGSVLVMRCCGLQGGSSLEECGPKVYAGKHTQKFNKNDKEVVVNDLARLVGSAQMCQTHNMAAVDGQEAVRQGGKVVLTQQLVVASKNLPLKYYKFTFMYF